MVDVHEDRSEPTALGDDTSGKISYYSPRIGGVQLGLSYIPQFEDGGSTNSSLTRIDGHGPTTDGVAMAVNFTGSVNGVGVEAYAGGLFADVAPANGSGNPWGIGTGAMFTFGGFEVGSSFALVLWFRHMVPIRRPSEFARLGAWGTVMLEYHKRRATTPGGSESRPTGRVSRSLGASDALDDGSPSPARVLLPRERETRSYGHHMSEPEH